MYSSSPHERKHVLPLISIVLFLICGFSPVHADIVLERGLAGWYNPVYHGKQTANGEVYDHLKLTAAHRTLPFNTWLRVVNEANGQSVFVRINDRGPFVQNRILDLSGAAAQKLGMLGGAPAMVKLILVDPQTVQAENAPALPSGQPTNGTNPYAQPVATNPYPQPASGNPYAQPSPTNPYGQSASGWPQTQPQRPWSATPVPASNTPQTPQNWPYTTPQSAQPTAQPAGQPNFVPTGQPQSYPPVQPLGAAQPQPTYTSPPSSPTGVFVPRPQAGSTVLQPHQGLTAEEYTVQLGAFGAAQTAFETAQLLRGCWVETLTLDNQTVYRVNYGIFDTRDAALQKQARLAQIGLNGFIRRLVSQ